MLLYLWNPKQIFTSAQEVVHSSNHHLSPLLAFLRSLSYILSNSLEEVSTSLIFSTHFKFLFDIPIVFEVLLLKFMDLWRHNLHVINL